MDGVVAGDGLHGLHAGSFCQADTHLVQRQVRGLPQKPLCHDSFLFLIDVFVV